MKVRQKAKFVYRTDNKNGRKVTENLCRAYKMVVNADRLNRKISVTLLRYHVNDPENAYVRVQFCARKTEEEKFQ